MREGDFQRIVPKHEFDGCREHAFGHDEVAPLSHDFWDPRNGWGATIVDAMSTMVCRSRYLPYVFQLNSALSTSWDSQYDDNNNLPFPLTVPDKCHKSRTSSMKHSTSRKASTSRNRTPRTPLSKCSAAKLYPVLMTRCSIFESTIRYVGGLISAYELSGKQHFFLIEKAKQLADRLSLAWSHVSVIERTNRDLSDRTLKRSRATPSRSEKLTSAPTRLSMERFVAAEQRSIVSVF